MDITQELQRMNVLLTNNKQNMVTLREMNGQLVKFPSGSIQMENMESRISQCKTQIEKNNEVRSLYA